MEEARRSVRRKSFLGAKASFHNSNSTLACLVRDVSETGAKLEFQHPKDVPSEFDLLITDRGQNHRCRVVWQRGTLFGVRFLATGAKPAGVLRRIA